MDFNSQVAVVTGANRGIGFETVRQLAKRGIQVILTSRDAAKGNAAIDRLKDEGLTVFHYPLTVTDPTSVRAIADFIQTQFGHLEILVNNAGVYLDLSDSTLASTDLGTVRQTMDTNVYGPLILIQALAPLMQSQPYGRIVNVSSGMGALTEMGGGAPAYRLSKTALNALTRIAASELAEANILVNSVCPGWVRTNMGGSQAPRSPEQAADTIVYLATLPDGSPSGKFWRDRQIIDW